MLGSSPDGPLDSPRWQRRGNATASNDHKSFRRAGLVLAGYDWLFATERKRSHVARHSCNESEGVWLAAVVASGRQGVALRSDGHSPSRVEPRGSAYLAARLCANIVRTYRDPCTGGYAALRIAL